MAVKLFKQQGPRVSCKVGWSDIAHFLPFLKLAHVQYKKNLSLAARVRGALSLSFFLSQEHSKIIFLFYFQIPCKNHCLEENLFALVFLHQEVGFPCYQGISTLLYCRLIL